MNGIIVAVAWFLYAAGWFALVVAPSRLGIDLWRTGYVPSFAELVPTATVMIGGAMFVLLGNFLIKRSR
jgi:hypothetical protein